MCNQCTRPSSWTTRKSIDECLGQSVRKGCIAFLPKARRVHLTRVHASVNGDVFWAELDPRAWQRVDRADFPADDRHAHAMSFETWERTSDP
jgi:hypothetical protein